MDITAIFDSVDTAEHALVQLQEQGVTPLYYKIQRTHPLPQQDTAKPYDPAPTMGLSSNLASVSGLPVAGIVVLATGGTPIDGGAESANADIASQEVKLTLTVEDMSGIRAHRSLISNHGRRVKFQ